MKLSAIARVLRSSGTYTRTVLPLGLLLSQNAWAAPGAVSVGNSSVSNSGTATTLSFPLTRSGDASYAAAIDYTTADGSAGAPTDYTARSGTVIMPAGSTAASIKIAIPGQSAQPDKDFFLQLLGATGVGRYPRFAAQQSFATGTNPTYMSLADVNGDGQPDLLVANFADNTVSVLLDTTAAGATSPSYAAQQTFATGANPVSVSAADVNGDGKPDLLVANLNDNTVSVLLNTTAPGATAPSYAAQQTFATGANPFSVTAADLNGDGRPDLLVANVDDNNVSVLLNTTVPGATIPSYAAQQTFAAGANPRSVTTADVNGDGKPDLLVANFSDNTVSVLLNATAPGATTPSYALQQTFASGTGPQFITTADVNGDGRPDLLVANYFSTTVSVLLNTTAPGATSPSYAAQQTFAAGAGPYFITAADLNGDGKADLLVASLSGKVSVRLNTTAPGATAPSYAAQQTFAAGTGPISLSAADVNGDGKPDLVVANHDSSTVSVLLNTTPAPATTFDASSLTTQQTFAAGSHPFYATSADVNGDGKPDLLVAAYGSNAVVVALNTTAAGATASSYAAAQSFAAGTNPNSVTAADVNGDGKPDLLVVNYNSNSVSVLLNTTAAGATSPSYAAQQSFATGAKPHSMTAADVNGDGKPDLLVPNYTSNTVSVLLNTTAAGATSPSFAAQRTFAAGTGPNSVTAADVNGDGKPDLVVADFSGVAVSILLNTTAAGATSPSYAAQQTFAAGTHPIYISSADVNGDGKPDLLVANYSSNTISVLLNTTAAGASIPAFAAQQTFATGPGPFSSAVADLDGDGKPDLLVANYGSNTISVLLNATAAGATIPSYAAQQSFATSNHPQGVAAADVNGDGKPDLLVASFVDNTVSVLLNAQYLASPSATPGDGTIHFVDLTPDPFSFTALKGVPLSTVETSNTITVTGITGAAPITFNGSGAYSVNSGTYTSAPGTVHNNDTVSIQLTSSASAKTSVHGSVVIGGVKGSFFVTTGTAATDTTPDAFAFTPVRNAGLSSQVDSNIVTITGINVATPISVSGGGSYSIAGGSFTTAPGTISNGQTVQLRLTSAATPGTALHAGLKVGTGSAPFVVTTAR